MKSRNAIVTIELYLFLGHLKPSLPHMDGSLDPGNQCSATERNWADMLSGSSYTDCIRNRSSQGTAVYSGAPSQFGINTG